ncbi:maleylpyruvate isomerase family mycothiol-dependent enzyme [Kribbella turkmenica]|uniref:Maleylpyruvate isomerase family mycothiol-dependent enzyme n=1 Tax=Kribbella turkmenica TaxID=2530375 RepID=A0A4R4X8U8_9ACTN|nr:FAD-dependent monooxygenase [Kribbella turkmenica]TDD26910.1 maleylpyruvate isomerase family mycothiol-dependent enzyme [Kribbella turkmenica]
MTERYDAVVVGARCAGSTLAILLARAGRRVLLVDPDQFPSDTVSTHVMFPDTLQRLEELGALAELRAVHEVRMVNFSWRVLGHAVAGGFTPIGGFDRATCIRRITLDAALVDLAEAAGAEIRTAGVTALIGDDPVQGVVLDTGERIESTWVFGADGRVSTVARRLGVRATDERRGEMAFLLAYWRGLPPADWCHIDVHERSALMSVPCEDGIHLLSVTGTPEITRGSATQREERYLAALHQFPAVLNARLLDGAERISPVVVVPETMLRGHYRKAAGPGWALLGDAGHFKHPVTAQGIADAIEQAWYIGTTLAAGGDLDGYQEWRDQRAAEYYEWSYSLAVFARGRAAATFSGLASDPAAGQDFLDTFTKQVLPSRVTTRERVARWTAAWSYDDGRRQVLALDLDEERLARQVPACPEWTVRDLIAHLAGIAGDSVRGSYFPGALDAWRDPAVAEQREAWTAGQVGRRSDRSIESVLREFDEYGGRLVTAMRRGALPGGPSWLLAAPVGDLAVHLADLREALGLEPDAMSPITHFGFAAYRDWLRVRIAEHGLPALRLSDGHKDWVLGSGEPGTTLEAGRTELFRAITGRRSAAAIRAYEWSGDPAPYLPVIAPYPLPADQVAAR